MWPLRFISLYLITLSTTNRSQEVLTWKYFKLEIANDIPIIQYPGYSEVYFRVDSKADGLVLN